MKQLGKIIRSQRKELQLTQKELAKLTGLHRNYISDIENGRRNVSLVNIRALFDALQLEINIKST